jgi:hypothetical protein
MDAVVERSNLWRAYERVMRNKGAAGVDGLTVFEFKAWLQQHWPSVKAALLAGDYLAAAIRKVDIPKPNGGVRTLGIPTVVDRLIQQALLQVLQPEFEPELSEHSYGFRPGRNAIRFFDPTMQAALEARGELEEALPGAISNHQLRLHYQIQVDAALRPIGADALLRWEHPELGVIAPM